MIGFYQEYDRLYDIYINAIKDLKAETLLDVGCGRGWFLQKLSKSLPYIKTKGIDLSEYMIKEALKKSLNVEKIDLCKEKSNYDIIVAIGDVLNYMNEDNLRSFLRCVEQRLSSGGYFLFDINNIYGFSDVAEGTLSVDNGKSFLVIDSVFEKNKLYNKITLFEKRAKCYKKVSANIIQYYHSVNKICNLSSLSFVSSCDIALFDNESDKNFLIFKK